MELQVIFDTKNRAYWNMALDESLLMNLQEIGPTLRVYGWEPHAVSIGYFQSMEEEVNVEVAREKGIDLVRRITGGGAIYHKWEVTYSIILPPFRGRILDSYRVINKGIVNALRKMGVDAKHHGINDVIVNNRKISGNAQTRKYGGLLQHGTVLMDVDVDEMFKVLRVPEEKLRDKTIENVKHRVTSLKHLGIEITFEEVQKYLVDGFIETFNAHVNEEKIPDYVYDLAKKLEVEKYATYEWNFRR